MQELIQVCIIDDDPEFANVMVEMCRTAWPEKQVDAVVCKDIREALTQLVRTTFHLITLDMFLPFIGGMSALALVYGYAPLTPIIIISGAQASIEYADHYNVKAVLMKPVPLAELIETLTRVVTEFQMPPGPRVDPIEQVSNAVLSYHLMYELFAEALDPILITDGHSIIAINKAASVLFGYHPSELLGQSADMLVAAEQREAHQRFREALLVNPVRRSNLNQYALTMVKKSGTPMPLMLDILPVVERLGIRFIVTFKPRVTV